MNMICTVTHSDFLSSTNTTNWLPHHLSCCAHCTGDRSQDSLKCTLQIYINSRWLYDLGINYLCTAKEACWCRVDVQFQHATFLLESMYVQVPVTANHLLEQGIMLIQFEYIYSVNHAFPGLPLGRRIVPSFQEFASLVLLNVTAVL